MHRGLRRFINQHLQLGNFRLDHESCDWILVDRIELQRNQTHRLDWLMQIASDCLILCFHVYLLRAPMIRDPCISLLLVFSTRGNSPDGGRGDQQWSNTPAKLVGSDE